MCDGITGDGATVTSHYDHECMDSTVMTSSSQTLDSMNYELKGSTPITLHLL